jgi:hypothetical protein
VGITSTRDLRLAMAADIGAPPFLGGRVGGTFRPGAKSLGPAAAACKVFSD